MPSILDRELSDRTADAFGHQQYADALRDLIESPSNRTPFSIGLLGSWGTGKSTIKEFYRRGLEDDKSGPRGQRRSDRVRAITFNAWRFGGEQDLKRSLLREAFRQLGGDEAALRKELFEQVNKVAHKKRPFRNWFGEAFGQIVGVAGVFVLLLLATLIVVFLFVIFTGLTDQYALSAVIAASVVATGWLGKHVVDLRVRSPAMYLPQTSIAFPATSAEEYENLLTEQIETFRRSDGAKCERLVIFVDDLDRLSAPEMVAGLDAIRTFLELPFNSAKTGFGVVFVISCDEVKIAEALHRGRGRLGAADLPGSVFSRADARRYLDRLFQFRLEIPLFPKQDMRQFALNKLSEADSVTADLKAKNVPVESVIDRLIHVDVQSPRNAIQLLNAFIQSWWIGTQREKSGSGSMAPGVLHKGAVTDHPLSLAALCVLRVDFPDFYECVQLRPEFIQEFRSVVFGTEAVATQAKVAQDMMKAFLAKGADNELTSEVQADHRKLRQYLSSVQDLRWPKRLQPLLRLAEDPITRQYGDGAATIRDALVSGDIRGVLEGFGRDLDTKELSQDDVTLLEGLTDTLSQETEARRISASRVLAGLVDRIPENRRRGLLTPLVRQMVDLAPVRMNAGPKAARQIIQNAMPQDRREVAEKFVLDLLHGEEIDWRLASGGAVNLNEAMPLVRATLDLVLEVRGSDNLPASADQVLRRWLLTRNVRVGDQTLTLSFAEFESLVSEHTTHLLADLGADYSDQAIAAFQSDADSITSVEATLSRIYSVFEQLADNGQEERAILWTQLVRLVSVQSIEATDTAWKTAAKHSDLADPSQACEFLSAFAARLIQHLESSDDLEIDWSERGRQFNDFLTGWGNHLDDETGLAIEPLISAWALVQECTEFAIRALNLVLKQNRPTWDKSMTTVLQTEMAKIPPNTCTYIGERASSLTDDHALHFIEQMDAMIDQGQLDKNASANYHQFVRSIPYGTWSTSPWSEHLERLFARTFQMHADADFLMLLFPSVIQLFAAAPNGRTAGLIAPLFENAAGAPDAYVVLHRSIVGYWPKTDDQIGDYQPDAIVERACQFIEANRNRVDLGDILCSLINLSECGVARDVLDKRIASIMPIVWRVAPHDLIANLHYVANVLEPSQTAEILSNDQPTDLHQDKLAALLTIVVDAYGSDAHYDVLAAILEQQPKPLFDTPDGALGEWMIAMGDMSDVIADRALGDPSLNDEQRRRVAAKLSDSFWVKRDMQAVETVLMIADAPNTRASVVGRLKDISNQSLSAEEKVKLVSRLIASLPSLSGDELATVGLVVLKLGGKGALEKSVAILNKLDDDQRETLRTIYPDSKILTDVGTS